VAIKKTPSGSEDYPIPNSCKLPASGLIYTYYSMTARKSNREFALAEKIWEKCCENK
jgi:hypothetical protein